MGRSIEHLTADASGHCCIDAMKTEGASYKHQGSREIRSTRRNHGEKTYCIESGFADDCTLQYRCTWRIRYVCQHDQFLMAWMQRDWAAGSSLLTPSELRKHSKSYLQEYFIGLSDPHHESFEITFDKWINPRHRLQYKRILEELPCAQSM